jgi:hypothetical protein
MLGFRWLRKAITPAPKRSEHPSSDTTLNARRRAARCCFCENGCRRPQWEQLVRKGYFEVVGNDSGKRYRIYTGTSVNVCEVDEGGRVQMGLCFTPIGALPIGDVILAQKIALETCEGKVRDAARRFVSRRFSI